MLDYCLFNDNWSFSHILLNLTYVVLFKFLTVEMRGMHRLGTVLKCPQLVPKTMGRSQCRSEHAVTSVSSLADIVLLV